MHVPLDQVLVLASVSAALLYFVIPWFRRRNGSGKCGGGCGCSISPKTASTQSKGALRR